MRVIALAYAITKDLTQDFPVSAFFRAQVPSRQRNALDRLIADHALSLGQHWSPTMKQTLQSIQACRSKTGRNREPVLQATIKFIAARAGVYLA